MDERAAGRPWTFKDPRTTVLHDLWLEHFPRAIGVFRRADLVVDSYLAQGWISGLSRRRIALSYWRRFNQSLLHVLDRWQGETYLLEMSSDFLTQLTVVLERLGLPMPADAEERFDASRQPARGADAAPRSARALHRALEARRTAA
jgi:hypothetical protein